MVGTSPAVLTFWSLISSICPYESVPVTVNPPWVFMNWQQSLTATLKRPESVFFWDWCKKARNFIHYREHPEPHFKPDMRKLGDMVKLSDAINFLWRVNRNIFNQGAYRQRPNLMKAYFNPPYNQDLSDSFGFPLEGPREGQESHRANHV